MKKRRINIQRDVESRNDITRNFPALVPELPIETIVEPEKINEDAQSQDTPESTNDQSAIVPEVPKKRGRTTKADL